MKRIILIATAATAYFSAANAQGSFSPQVGEVGSNAIHKDSTAFRDWAISCSAEIGLRQIDEPDSGYASAGSTVYAVGKADAPLTLSLGDGGSATLQFSASFYDGDGPDFAVFENGFGQGEDAFLELAFVEVSSDGENFVRFPAVSEVTVATQKGTFEYTDARLLQNLAGKYIANFGVPFDLADLPDTSILDKHHVTHVRIIDVVGVIDSSFASFDSQGNIINDPWPTNFSQGGFDLDAIGIINSNIPLSISEFHKDNNTESMLKHDLMGRPVYEGQNSDFPRMIIDANGNKRVVMGR
ncbi:MAG: T9SS C-terminal target domain-containing protein [Salibacteraceae bacterium]